MNCLISKWLIVMTTVLGMTTVANSADPEKFRVYFGTYSGELSKGIYVSTFDAATGKLSAPELAAEVKNASFLAIHPSRKNLYAVSEIADFEGKKQGGVSAFEIDSATGRLKLLNQQSSGGGGPCHLVTDAQGTNVLVANYGGGSVSVLPILADGKLSPASSTIQHQGSSVDKQRQEGPHAHSINLDPANKFAFAADLGLDKVLVYRFDGSKGLLTANDPPAGVVAPGSGPRHFAFHPSGKYAFVNNEMTSTITSFAYDPAKGSLKEIHTLSTIPEPTPGNSTAETVVHPSGKFVYVSNRGHNSLAIYQCDPATGRLTALGHQSTGGKTPRNFNIDPTGSYVLAANQDTNNVTVLKIDAATGKLSPTGAAIEVGIPVCVKFVPLP
ncbi:lactonase family protein [Schlesneria sp. DSM 10557]|uniref:lactonase family protein n=1 Tax=Schlesneria sp. DSM 10557 TaxID=3044399 RepID=UPI0035A126FA